MPWWDMNVPEWLAKESCWNAKWAVLTVIYMKYENNEWYDDILRQYNMNKWQTEHMWIEYNVRASTKVYYVLTAKIWGWAWQRDCHYELVINIEVWSTDKNVTLYWNGLGQ